MARKYLVAPGFERNQWLVDELVRHGIETDVFFPARDGLSQRLIWRFSIGGRRFMHRTSYGTLGENDLDVMLGMAGVERKAR